MKEICTDLPSPLRRSRRHFLMAAAATGALLAAPHAAWAQDAPADAAEGERFSFDALTEAARIRASEPYQPAEAATGFVEDMTYSQYRQINFEAEHARWTDAGGPFLLQAFHLGWLFDTPVPLYEVVDVEARRFTFTSDDFVYRNEAEGLIEPGTELPGVAGFRLHYPLNRADVNDELVAFQGASYFRALGRGNAYGLSARGLAINTAMDGEEEFPTFSAFYLERPAPGAQTITLYADLDSESVAGAYRFVIDPGEQTVIDVTARLFFRERVENLGLAPLTSMFLFAETNRQRFDDYRPQVHDSSGLLMRRADGDALWRSLNNPPRLATSYFTENAFAGFGLHQRDREFEDYQDAEARYEDRPSVDVEFVGDWGEGAVRLVEIPSDLEVNDNIVAYWTPSEPVEAGEAREYQYRLHWGMLEADPRADTAHVLETRSGTGGVSGVENEDGSRKFVVDFAGGRLSRMPSDAEVEVDLSVSRGEVVGHTLSKIPGTDVWRLVVDVVPEPTEAMELVAFVKGYEMKLSETWLYQWIDQK